VSSPLSNQSLADLVLLLIGISLIQSVLAFAYPLDPHGPARIFYDSKHWASYAGGLLGAATFMTADTLLVRRLISISMCIDSQYTLIQAFTRSIAVS
jgi:uncharacterized membrane protein YdcZ (DUF606 family)